MPNVFRSVSINVHFTKGNKAENYFLAGLAIVSSNVQFPIIFFSFIFMESIIIISDAISKNNSEILLNRLERQFESGKLYVNIRVCQSNG